MPSLQASTEALSNEVEEKIHTVVHKKDSTNSAVADEISSAENIQYLNTDKGKKTNVQEDKLVSTASQVDSLKDTKAEEQQIQVVSTSSGTHGPQPNVAHAVMKSKGWLSNSNSTQIDFQLISPFPPTLHADLYLKPGVLVDENQPSSIIAYTLASSKLITIDH